MPPSLDRLAHPAATAGIANATAARTTASLRITGAPPGALNETTVHWRPSYLAGARPLALRLASRRVCPVQLSLSAGQGTNLTVADRFWTNVQSLVAMKPGRLLVLLVLAGCGGKSRRRAARSTAASFRPGRPPASRTRTRRCRTCSASGGAITAILFGDPLVAPPAKDRANKILWVARRPVNTPGALKIRARDGSARGRPHLAERRRPVDRGPPGRAAGRST